MKTVHNIRHQLAQNFQSQNFVTDKSGVKMLEIMNATFWANSPLIFGAVNEDYVQRELEWYKSESLNVNDIPGGTPAIWKQVSDRDGFINSNYGWCVYSEENNNQFANVLQELLTTRDSRRATMIYTRPTMWGDHIKNGRSDFMCTNAVQYMIRNNRVYAIVNMRSNDAWAGYRNDYAWQLHVLEDLTNNLNWQGANVERGEIYWNAGSLHIYERQFYLVDHFIKSGELSITKENYDAKYGTK